MTTVFFEQQRQNIKRLLAEGVGCSPEDLERDQLTIIDHTKANPWDAVLAVRFGVGVVVSVEQRFRSYIERHIPARYFHALRPELLQRMADECSTALETLTYHPPSICWGIGETPADDSQPSDHRLELVGRDWMNERLSQPGWVNGIGTESTARHLRNQFAFALLDHDNRLAAVAGVFLTYGLYEIGVDVAPEYRGRGFAARVVRAACVEILRRGGTPLYVCAADNIRSQRTALACGFLPVYSEASVTVATRE